MPNKKRADMTPEELERAKEYDRKKYLKNREKIIERQIINNNNRKEEKAEYDRSRREGEDREKILKLGRKNKWINRFGVKFDSEEEFEAVYERYISTWYCDLCNLSLIHISEPTRPY